MSNAPIPKLAYRVPEAAKATGISRSTLYQHIADGVLKARKREGITLIMSADLHSYLDSYSEVK